MGQWIDDGADCANQTGDGDGGGEGSGGDDGAGSSAGPEAATAIIMNDHCSSCHSGASPIGGFGVEVDLCDQLVNQVGNSGMTLVVPGDADGSLLVQRMLDEASPMPPNGLLDQPDIDTVKDWINAGAECGEPSSEGAGDGGLEDTGTSDVAGRVYDEFNPTLPMDSRKRGVVQ